MLILGNSYQGTIIKIALFAMGLAFLIPSGVSRVVLLIPIIVSLADHFGYDSDSNGRGHVISRCIRNIFTRLFHFTCQRPQHVVVGNDRSLI